MPQQYLLPCSECERKLPVEAAQAGERVRCECGANIAVPAFRIIRQLEPVESDAPQVVERKWTRAQGVMFSLGIFVVLVAIGLGTFPLLRRANLRLEKPPPADLTAAYEAIDAMSPDQTLDYWIKVQEIGVNREAPPLYVMHREFASQLDLVIAIAAIMAAAGIASTVGAFFVGPRPQRRTRTRQ